MHMVLYYCSRHLELQRLGKEITTTSARLVVFLCPKDLTPSTAQLDDKQTKNAPEGV